MTTMNASRILDSCGWTTVFGRLLNVRENRTGSLADRAILAAERRLERLERSRTAGSPATRRRSIARRGRN